MQQVVPPFFDWSRREDIREEPLHIPSYVTRRAKFVPYINAFVIYRNISQNKIPLADLRLNYQLNTKTRVVRMTRQSKNALAYHQVGKEVRPNYDRAANYQIAD